jgi:Fe2+ or Zn2+ uptake regulation protein
VYKEVSKKFWSDFPLHTALIKALRRRKGVSTDKELYKVLRDDNEDLCFKNFNKTLMKLEVEGVIHVLALTKNKRRIELANTQ